MANTTKKTLEEDFTNQPQATTKDEVDAQDSRTRLWQSFQYPYQKQMEDSDRQYDKAVSQANNQALTRGMQRSSYNNQVVGNLLNQKINARNDLGKSLISEYQRALNTQEEAEANRAFQTAEREAQQAWQAEQNALNREQEQSQFEIKQAFSEKQWADQQEQWREEFGYQQKSDDQKLAYNYVMAMIEKGKTPSDDLLARAGLSNADYTTMTAQASGGTPYWASLKFNSENDYAEARHMGLTRDSNTYYALKNGTSGTGTNTDPDRKLDYAFGIKVD